MSVKIEPACPLLGLRGQKLGVVSAAALDPNTGALKHLVLETRWQRLDIPWRQVAFDEEQNVFKLVARGPP